MVTKEKLLRRLKVAREKLEGTPPALAGERGAYLKGEISVLEEWLDDVDHSRIATVEDAARIISSALRALQENAGILVTDIEIEKIDTTLVSDHHFKRTLVPVLKGHRKEEVSW